MTLILIDALPRGQVLVNTDHIIQARELDGDIEVMLSDGNSVKVPQSTVHDLLDDIKESVEAAQNPVVPI